MSKPPHGESSFLLSQELRFSSSWPYAPNSEEKPRVLVEGERIEHHSVRLLAFPPNGNRLITDVAEIKALFLPVSFNRLLERFQVYERPLATDSIVDPIIVNPYIGIQAPQDLLK